MKRILLLIACSATLAACGSDSELPNPTGKGAVRMINAMPGSPPVRFLIEERADALVNYKGISTPEQYDDFSYTFNFEVGLPGESQFTRFASSTIAVEKDREHMFMLSGNIDNPVITFWDGDIRAFNDGDTVLEARFSHASATLGDIDVYFDPPGTVLGTNPPAATLAFGEISNPADFAAGEYVLTVTDANDPGTVHFATSGNDLLAQFAHVVTVFDGDANDTGTVAVRTMTSVGNPLTFNDVTNPAALRFINTAFETQAVDIYRDDQLTDLVAANVTFGGTTAYLDAPTETTTYYFTPAGNTAQIIFEQEYTAQAPATYANIFIAGRAAGELAIRLVPDRAPYSSSARMSIFHGATNNSSFNAYLVERGEEFTDQIGAIMVDVRFLASSPVVDLVPGSYDLYLRDRTTLEVISPALPVDLVAGEVVELIAVDTADTAVIETIDITLP
ncbi:MAG: DUF4397 domain-containing protein [Woeseiaceae bacterium]|nr:DUF4397 domain-containing protein [Woeseiaceae bacterium]